MDVGEDLIQDLISPQVLNTEFKIKKGNISVFSFGVLKNRDQNFQLVIQLFVVVRKIQNEQIELYLNSR